MRFQFLKKHYEKIILSLVLAGLAVAAGLLTLKVGAVKSDLEGTTRVIGKGKGKPLEPVDLSTNQATLKRVRSRQPLTIAWEGHSVFNPIMWVKGPGGRKLPKEDTGLAMLVVTNIAPLKTEVVYQGPREAGNVFRYRFQLMREASTNSALWRPFQRIVAIGDRANEVFSLKEARGPAADPTELVVELVVDSRKTVTLTKDNPTYAEIGGYAADLRHEAENRNYPHQRQGQKLTLAGVTYNIVAISESDVTLEDSQTKKRTIIRLKGSS